jgi:long-chain fatty acid transport protein
MGAGFHIREQGAKAMGMANAFVAQADDPSAIFYTLPVSHFLKVLP